MLKFVIQHTEEKQYLSKVALEKKEIYLEQNLEYVISPENALQFETADEANAVITFIGDVIDWEEEQQLEIRSVVV